MSDYDEYIAGIRRRLGDPACLMCGDDSPKALESIDRYDAEVEGVHLCWRCCDFAATAYARSHGGMPPDAFSPVPRFVKAVLIFAVSAASVKFCAKAGAMNRN